MSFLGFSLSRAKKASPEQSGVDVIGGGPEDLPGRLDEAEHNIRELLTAVNRIERKQNRWLDVLNIKDQPDNGDKIAAAAAPDQNLGMNAGEEDTV